MKLSLMALAAASVSLFVGVVEAAPYTPGNLVLSRVGDGSAALGAATSAVFLDEYTTAGVNANNTLALPTAASGSNFTFTLGGTSTSQGQLTRSPDGRFLTMYGYDTPVGTTGPASNGTFQGRTVARIDQNGNVDTSTRFVAAGTTPRAAVTSNGTDIWVASDIGSNAGGLRYVTYGSNTSGTLLNSTTNNIRTVNIFNGQLYGSASTGVGGEYRGVFSVGTGLPTSTASFTLLPGMGGNNAGNSDSSYDFFFSDANTVYVTDDDTTAPASGGVQKWSFNGTTWAKQWTINAANATGARSITGRVLPTGAVELFAIASNTTSDLFSILDTGSGTPTATFLASAPTNTVFRGVEFAAIPEPASLAGLSAFTLLVRRQRRA